MKPPTVIHLDVPADVQCLSIITASLNEVIQAQPQLADRELISHNVQLAVHEIGMNIIEHAYADQADGRLALTLTLDTLAAGAGCRLIVEMIDTGAHSFDPAVVAAPNLDEPQVGGYGLFLARQLMDEVEYQIRATDHYWRLIKNLEM